MRSVIFAIAFLAMPASAIAEGCFYDHKASKPQQTVMTEKPTSSIQDKKG